MVSARSKYRTTSQCSQSFTRCLNNAIRFDALSKSPSSALPIPNISTRYFWVLVPVGLKDELIQIAVDRLAQIVQVAKTTECLSGRKCKSVLTSVSLY